MGNPRGILHTGIISFTVIARGMKDRRERTWNLSINKRVLTLQRQ